MKNQRFKSRLVSSSCLLVILSSSLVRCAPITSDDELCSVDLVPKELISKRYDESNTKIVCEATIDSANGTQFANPVFDLSFGGAPRTGIFIIRGNVTCDESRTKCWSQFNLSANSIGNLIQHSRLIEFSCQVADQLKNAPIDKALARCENKGYLGYTNVLKFGDLCSTNDVQQECDLNMKCGTPEAETETESESELQCVCKSGYTSIPLSSKLTICAEEAMIGSKCNYTKQCTETDSNSICKVNDIGVKVCQCSEDSYLFSEYKTDYIKTCRIKPTTTSSPATEEGFDVILGTTLGPNEGIKLDNKSENLVEDKNNAILKEMGNKTTKSKAKKNLDSTTNAGIIFFFLAILLAIFIVIIIIRVRNKSDKITINKMRTSEQQTDGKDGEQRQPILNENKEGEDEVDENNDNDNNDNNKQMSNNGITPQHKSDDISEEQNNKKFNNINDNDSQMNQKIQTNV